MCRGGALRRCHAHRALGGGAFFSARLESIAWRVLRRAASRALLRSSAVLKAVVNGDTVVVLVSDALLRTLESRNWRGIDNRRSARVNDISLPTRGRCRLSLFSRQRFLGRKLETGLQTQNIRRRQTQRAYLQRAPFAPNHLSRGGGHCRATL